MSTLLLHTKLSPPLVRHTQVSRTRLLTRLDQIEDGHHHLSLIAAPAGFGKTALLSEWVAQGQHRVAWLSLDELDNDPVRFWDYMVAALRTLYPHLGEQALSLLHEPQPLPIEAILTPLLNEMAATPETFVLILDDYHVIEAESVHHGLSFLLEHLPPPLHLIIATRADPPLPLARLRVRQQLLELRATDLRFATQEVAAFLHRMTGLALADGALAALETRTEGWVAGLQLAALALQDQPDVDAFITRFAGDHHYLLDYLGDEVLDRQPESVQQFLLHSSILDRLSGPLCAAVTGVTHSQSLLESLERGGFFLTALDEKRQWYRYHHLFADFLRHRLQRDQPTQVPELHRRASTWFAHQGLLLEAVDHALAAPDFAQAAQLIEETAELLLWRRTELHTLQRWLQALPETILETRPRLCLYHAWVLYLVSQLGAAERRVQDAERALAARADTADSLTTGMLAAIRSTLTGIRQEFVPATTFSRQALTLLPAGAISWRCVAAINLGVSCAAIGEVDEAVAVLHEAMELSEEVGSAFALLSAFWHRATLQATQLQLTAAEATCRQLLHLTDTATLQRFPVAGYIALLLGEIALERNDLDVAVHHLLESADQINPEGFPLALLRSYVALTRAKLAQGDMASAAEFLRRAEELVRVKKLQSRSSPLAVLRAQLWLAEGNLAAAAHWVEENRLGVDDEFSYHRESYYLVLVRLLLANARVEPAGAHLDKAFHLLARMVRRAEVTGRTGSLCRALVLQALALAQHGDDRCAVQTLVRALAQAEPEQCVRTFADEGAPMAALLQQVLEAQRTGQLRDTGTIAPPYLHTLLAALGRRIATPPMSQADTLFHLEPLSAREVEVLHLLAEGLSSNEIAQRLVIAVGTARRHIKNIYGKLDVHSRFEAVRRAQEIGLL